MENATITTAETILTTGNITFAIGIIALLFSLWNRVKDPQDQLDKKVALDSVASDKRDAMLDQRLRYQNDSIEQRFKAMQCNFDQLLTFNNNHVHTIETSVTSLTATVGSLGNEVTRLGAIINERIPRKTK